MNHKWNTFSRCEYCGILKSTSNALQTCVPKDEYPADNSDPLISAATMATFTSLFNSDDSYDTDTFSSDSGSDSFSGGGGDFGGGGAGGDF